MRKRSKEHTEAEINLGIIITPFLDMAFQLLIFFIITYHPSAQEGHVDIDLLPPSKVATKGSAPKDPDALPTDEEPKLEDVLTVQLKAVGATEGLPNQILLKRKEQSEGQVVATSDLKFQDGLKLLKSELEKFLREPDASNANLKIEADGDLKYSYATDVYDTCKLALGDPKNPKSGFRKINLVGPPNLLSK